MTLALGVDTTDRLVRELDSERWVDAALALTTDLGFRLVEPSPSGRRGLTTEAHLVVALRDHPTLRHFDPESLSFYAPDGSGASLVTLSRLPAGMCRHRPVLWGHVHMVDRVPVENRFLTFGGELSVDGRDGSVTIAHLRSPAPIVRWGGHSQGTDPLTLAIGAFFGRLIVPVDFQAGAAAIVDAASPEVLFAAFLCDAVGRGPRIDRRSGELSDLDLWLRAAWVRARSDPRIRDAAERLLADVGL